jgi:penicillin amidase
VLELLTPGGQETPNGSNNWVVGGARTETGKPLLANDPHLGLDIPSIWYAAHLRLRDGSLDVAGVTFPGIPGVIIGHTSEIAWGVTNFNPDVQDLYAEEFDAAGRRYRVGARWQDAEVRTERVLVRTDPLHTDVEERTVTVTVTRHGPIVSDLGTTKYALRWTALDPVSEMPAFYLLDRATDWDSFRAALRQYPGPMQNFVYADRSGNIGYYAAGNVPVRRAGTGDVPYGGAGDEGDWVGFIPFEDLPHAFNPAEGFVVTANNRVLGTTTRRFYTHEWMAPFRARRITELLREKDRATSADMSAIQADVYSYPDAIFAREVLAMARARVAAGDTRDWRDLAARLDGWDGRLTVDSTAASLVVTMRKLFAERIFAARLGDRSRAYGWLNREAVVATVVENRPPEWLPQGVGSWEELVLQCYRSARRTLATQLGDDPEEWRYGRLNTFAFVHPLGQVPGLASVLNPPPFEMDGGPQTVKALQGGAFTGERKWGASMRLVVDLADFDRTTLNLPTGQSGQQASEHYMDQVEDWRFVRPHPFPYTERAVRESTAETLLLTPAPPSP